MKREIQFLLLEIIDMINDIEITLQGLGLEDYRNNRRAKIYVVGFFEGIRDKVNQLPDEFKEDNWKELWDEFTDIQKIFVIDELGVNEDAVWKTSKFKLKKLRMFINEVLKGKDNFKMSSVFGET